MRKKNSKFCTCLSLDLNLRTIAKNDPKKYPNFNKLYCPAKKCKKLSKFETVLKERYFATLLKSHMFSNIRYTAKNSKKSSNLATFPKKTLQKFKPSFFVRRKSTSGYLCQKRKFKPKKEGVFFRPPKLDAQSALERRLQLSLLCICGSNF
jgi:hypothetical protein